MFFRLARNRNFWITLFTDVCLVLAAYYCAYLIRFDGVVPDGQRMLFFHTAWWILLLKVGCFIGFDLYKGMWRYFSVHDVINVVKACVLAFVLTAMILLGLHRSDGFSRSVYLIDMILCLLFIGGFRLAIRLALVSQHESWRRIFFRKYNPRLKNMLIVGAGSAGEKLLRELNENANLDYDVVGFVDDDPKSSSRPCTACRCSAHCRSWGRSSASTGCTRSPSRCRPHRPGRCAGSSASAKAPG